jgi:hypothetical protein
MKWDYMIEEISGTREATGKKLSELGSAGWAPRFRGSKVGLAVDLASVNLVLRSAVFFDRYLYW